MLRGGQPREWSRPLRWDGNIADDVRGCHRGPAAPLNVHNPQPGFIYYWARHPKSDRGSMLQRFRNVGWEVVPPESPEYKGRAQSLSYPELGLDSYNVHGDLVLLRIPESKYAQLEEYRRQLAEVARIGATDEFLSKSQGLDARYGQAADGPIFYRGPGHGLHS